MTQRTARISWADRRRQIIHVAMELFARRGFRGTTTREIAARVRMNEAILFRHFKHKEDLYWAVIDAKLHGALGRRELYRTLREAKSPREAFVAIAEGILRRNAADPARSRLLLFSALENHRLSQRFFRVYIVRYYDVLADYIRALIRRKQFRHVDPQLAARGFLGMFTQHHQVQELFGGKRFRRYDPRRVSATLTDVWLAGMLYSNGHRGAGKGAYRHR
jgi:TetR/AcrR family transcriptional regulator